MSATITRKLLGRIILVQEDRFRIVEDTGKGYLFTLSHRAQVSERDLKRWHDADTKVIVEYEGAPNLASGVAHSIVPYS